MYKFLVRPILFCFPPEKAHKITFSLLKISKYIPFALLLIKKIHKVKSENIELFGLQFPGRVGLAAGLDKSASAYNQLFNFGFSHIEIGTITPKPQKGNPKPRLFRLVKDHALINRMGFNNIGADEARKKLKKNKPRGVLGVNIGKNTFTPNEKAVDDYVYCFNTLFDVADYFVVNVSCPNIQDLSKLQNKDETGKILSAIQNVNLKKDKPKAVLLKISPDLSFAQLDELIPLVDEYHLAGIVATNTTTYRKGLSYSKDEINQFGNGGLSGLPLKDRATEMIRYLSQKLGARCPIIGVGGIMSAQDALEKLYAGASLVQIYTGFVYKGTALVKQINKAVKKEDRFKK